MNLAFSQKINDKPSFFLEKIHRGLIMPMEQLDIYIQAYYNKFGQYWDGCAEKDKDIKPKIHTIREDPTDRWREGMHIHFIINNRTHNRFQFAPIVKVKSIQKITIKPFGTFPLKSPVVYVGDDKMQNGLSDEALKELAMNDGFDSVEDFFKFFNTDFTGKLICWTDKKY